MLRFASLWTCLVCALAATAAAREVRQPHGPVPSVEAVRASEPFRIDGRLDEAAWSAATPVTSFRQLDPKEGEPATERTELRVAYDADALYVGFRLFDSEPSRVVRRLSRRDDYAKDADLVRLYLDPQLDHLTGVQLELTAAGVQSDAVLYNDSWDDSSWDAVWESAVSQDEQGWSAEIRIPFSQLRFSAGEHQVWGINASRFIQRKNETDWLELVPKKESGVCSRMAHLTGLDGLKPRRALSLLPYVVGRSEHVAPASGDPFHDGSEQGLGFGLDLKYGVTSSLTLDGTVNPDFGQVEVDPAVVNLTQFETFFDEKRPFFIEGAQIFSNFGRNGANNFWGFNRSEPNLFYSRRIGRCPQGETDQEFVDRPQSTTILGAAKLSGKTKGGWSLAALEAVTAREFADTFDAGQRSRVEIEPLTNYFIVRAHKDTALGGVGFLGTATLRQLDEAVLRETLVRRAFVAGVDGYRFLDAKKDWVVTGRLAFSHIAGDSGALDGIQQQPQHYFQRPDSKEPRLDPNATSLSGWTGSLNLNRNSGNLQMNAAVWATSPGFESNDLGFNQQSDRWGAHLVGTWKKTKPDGFSRTRSLSVAKWYTLNYDGDRQSDGLMAFFNAQLRNYWNIGLNGRKSFRTLNDTFTRGGPSGENPAGQGADAWFETDTRKRATANLEVYRESDARGESFFGLWLTAKLKPTSGLSLQLGPSLRKPHAVAQWVGAFEDPTATATYGQRYVFADLRQTEYAMVTRLNWILSPRMSLQIYAQPLISSGDYTGFKEFTQPRGFAFARYGVDRGSIGFDAAAGQYQVDPDGSGPAPPFSFDNPDFNFKSLRFNAVFRWEWRLGSALYVVWTQNRTNDANPGTLDLGRDTRALFAAPGDNVFLVKFTYRLGR